MLDESRTERRLRLKIAKRDRRIEGLMRRVAALETELATQVLMAERTPADIARAVQHALANVRMIAVPPIGRTTRIEVRTDEEPDHAR